MMRTIITEEPAVLKGNLERDGALLLTYQIEYPVFHANRYQMAISVINEYYKARALGEEAYVKTSLFEEAKKQYEELLAKGALMPPFERVSVYQVTYLRECIISLYFDRYTYTGGAHGTTVRTSDTWDLPALGRVKLSDLFACGVDYRSFLLSGIKEQAKREPDLYFEDVEAKIEEAFDERNFYCKKDGLVIYFGQYEIAPYVSGIREFFFPYSDMLYNPIRTCSPLLR